jgi:gamma-glutamyl-gamma-aminobutyrate hydrolase PuuD
MIINPLVIKPVAYSDDVIEAVEKDDRAFFVGVQWHPEDMNDIYSENLFKAFFETCKYYHEKSLDYGNNN